MTPSINFTILIAALRALKEGNIRYCENIGFTFEEMNNLNKLTLDELFIISRESEQFINVRLNHDVLCMLLKNSHEQYHCQQQIDRAIQLGGSIALLNRYFGLTSNEVSLRRRLLDVVIPFGRPPIPDEETDIGIWLEWQKCRVNKLDSTDALISMMQVTENLTSLQGSPSLTVVWNRITLFEREAIDKEKSNAR